MDLKEYIISRFSQEGIDILDKIMMDIFSFLKLILRKYIEYTMKSENWKSLMNKNKNRMLIFY